MLQILQTDWGALIPLIPSGCPLSANVQALRICAKEKISIPQA
jgi:hypothetical protein